MSIIYNALEKTQKNRENNRESKREANIFIKPKRRSLPWLRIMTVTVVSCLAIMAVKHYPSPSKTIAANLPLAMNTSAPVVKNADHKSKLILNGVFLSDLNKVAMINNQSFTLGDQINGMTVVDIGMNSVKLRDDKNTTVLYPMG